MTHAVSSSSTPHSAYHTANASISRESSAKMPGSIAAGGAVAVRDLAKKRCSLLNALYDAVGLVHQEFCEEVLLA